LFWTVIIKNKTKYDIIPIISSKNFLFSPRIYQYKNYSWTRVQKGQTNIQLQENQNKTRGKPVKNPSVKKNGGQKTNKENPFLV